MNLLVEMLDEIIIVLQAEFENSTELERKRRIAAYVVILNKVRNFFYS